MGNDIENAGFREMMYKVVVQTVLFLWEREFGYHGVNAEYFGGVSPYDC